MTSPDQPRPIEHAESTEQLRANFIESARLLGEKAEKVVRLTAQLAELRQAFDTYAGIAEPKIAGLEADQREDQRVRDAARSLCERFYEGLSIDVAVGNLQAELDKGRRW